MDDEPLAGVELTTGAELTVGNETRVGAVVLTNAKSKSIRVKT